MTRWARRGAAATLSVLLLSTAACSDSDDDKDDVTREPAKAADVSLTADGVPANLSVGVVVSLAGDGSEWSTAAEGARVAAYRLGLGGAKVKLIPADDKGTRNGAIEAVRQLADAGVAGIVMATSGPHVDGGLREASKRDIPVLLPYQYAAQSLPDGTWTTGPVKADVGTALAQGLGSQQASKPLVVEAGGGQPAGIEPVETVLFDSPDDAKAIARQVKRAEGRGSVDSVVVSGPESAQVAVVSALQQRAVRVPVLLGPEALSPAFAPDLVEAGGSTSGTLVSAGLDNGDVAALARGGQGQALSAWLTGVRLTASDPEVTDMFDGEPFETVAADADAASHDALLSLVLAAAAAQSTEPKDVTAALGELTVDAGDGVAGPALDFSAAQNAAPGDAVVALQATSEDPGLRPVVPDAAPDLFWFKLPDS